MKRLKSDFLNQVSMVDFNLPSFLHAELSPIAIVVASLILVIGVDISLTISLEPDREFVVVPPGVGH